MDFLDDLDAAFDNMLVGGESDQEPAGPVEQEPMDGLDDLHHHLAHENLAPITALTANMNDFHKRYLLAALSGSLTYLGTVDRDDHRKELISRSLDLLRTRKGTVRKVMAKERMKQLKALLQAISDHFGTVSDHRARELLLELQRARISSDTVHTLFSSGLSCPDTVAKAPVHEIEHITHLDKDSVLAVKALFPKKG